MQEAGGNREAKADLAERKNSHAENNKKIESYTVRVIWSSQVYPQEITAIIVMESFDMCKCYFCALGHDFSIFLHGSGGGSSPNKTIFRGCCKNCQYQTSQS